MNIDDIFEVSEKSNSYSINSDLIPNYLRIFKIGVINNKFDISPNKSRIRHDKWELCRLLSNQGFVIGGSTLLKLCGLLDRDVDDIDVFYNFEKESDLPIIINKVVNTTKDYDDEELRMKVESNYGKLDIFKRDYKNFSFYDGVRIGSIYNCLNAKMKYMREKDIVDFEAIFNKTIFS